MAPDDGHAEVFYGVRAIAPPPLRIKVPHRQQSIDARRLLADLSARVLAQKPETERHSSLSHSRSVVAAAIACQGRVGIDIEYMCPRRDIHAILGMFLGPVDNTVAPAALYKAWTFGEAYFKAFGELPDAESLARAVEHHADNGLYHVDRPDCPAIGIFHSEPLDNFALTLVWERTNQEADWFSKIRKLSE